MIKVQVTLLNVLKNISSAFNISINDEPAALDNFRTAKLFVSFFHSRELFLFGEFVPTMRASFSL